MNLVLKDVEQSITALTKLKGGSAAKPIRNVGGRPLKFKSVAALQKATEAYFRKLLVTR
jgi:hypothetical protein